MGEWIFQAILSMVCGALIYLYFLKLCIVPPGTSVFTIGNNDFDHTSQVNKHLSPP